MWKKSVLCLWAISIVYVIFESITPTPDFPADFNFADKVYHALAYAWLAALPTVGFRQRKAALYATGAMIVLGVALEIVQAFLPTRSCELGDMLADAVGAVSGFYLGSLIKK